jgi:SOS-response transcriptional repressor LexA
MSKMKKHTLTAEQHEECRRLKALWEGRKATLGLTQQRLADAIGEGITQGAVGHYLNARNALNIEAALAFSKALQVDVEDFSPRLASSLPASALPENTYTLPLLTAETALDWERSIKSTAKSVPGTTVAHSNRAFAMVVDGDAMTRPDGQRDYSFPHGMLIYIDPNQPANAGDFVLARTDSPRAKFRKLLFDEGRQTLVPLHQNRALYPVTTGDFQIIGRVFDASWGGI